MPALLNAYTWLQDIDISAFDAEGANSTDVLEKSLANLSLHGNALEQLNEDGVVDEEHREQVERVFEPEFLSAKVSCLGESTLNDHVLQVAAILGKLDEIIEKGEKW